MLFLPPLLPFRPMPFCVATVFFFPFMVMLEADAAVAAAFFVRYLFKSYLGKPTPISTLAQARTIDMAIQVGEDSMGCMR